MLRRGHPIATTASKHGYGQGGSASAPYNMPLFSRVKVGWAEYQSTRSPYELWIDEIALHGERIGCAR